MAFWDKEKEIAIIDKNKKEKVRILAGVREDKCFLDFRIMNLRADEEGQPAAWKPGSYGATMPIKSIEDWNDIKSKIDSAISELISGGSPKEEV